MRDAPGGGLALHAAHSDGLLAATAVLNAALAAALGLRFAQSGLALGAGAALTALAGAAWWLLRGRTAACLLLAAANAALVVLQIQLARGQVEYHFNIFILLGILAVYRRALPVLATGLFFTAHHLLFDQLLQRGIGAYCMAEPDPSRAWLHVGFIAVHTGWLLVMVRRARQQAAEGLELQAIVAALGQDGPPLLRQAADTPAGTRTGARLQRALQRMADTLGGVQGEAAGVRQAAAALSAGSDELRERTDRSALGLRGAAESLGQISTLVRHSTDAAQQAGGMSQTADAATRRATEVVAQIVHTMGAIDTASRRITDIVAVIDGIAFQTNLLALNAAVEAARAGEQGRGFAVVAGEVRALARRSAEAAREVKALVGTSMDRVQDGNQAVASAGEAMQAIQHAVQQLGQLIQTISVDTAEQAQGLFMVDHSVQALDEMTRDNSGLVQRTLDIAAQLDGQSQQLAGLLASFALGEAPWRPAGDDTDHPYTAEPAPSAAPLAQPVPARSAPPTLPAAPALAGDSSRIELF